VKHFFVQINLEKGKYMKGVDYVLHAAALKQVPSCEFFPMQAVKTNVIGAENILNYAIEADVEKVVVLSADKAVYPINAMGESYDRDLNYNKFFIERETNVSDIEDYTSHDTIRLQCVAGQRTDIEA